MHASGAEPEDDLDPLAPVLYDSDVVEEEEEDVDENDGGFSDTERIVRIWLTDGRLSKVRVSPVWYRRLGKRSLGDCFNQAFRFANLYIPEVDEDEEPEAAPNRFADYDFSQFPAFDGHVLAVMQQELEQARVRWDEAIERHRARLPAKPRLAVGRSKGVTVTLNEVGRANSVEFDEKWLDDAHAGAICNHVQQAALDAYRRFVPPPAADRSELDACATEYEFLQAILYATLNKPRTISKER